MTPTTTITAKSQIDSLPHEATVEIVGEHVSYLNLFGTPDTFGASDRCQVRLDDEPVVVEIDDELRYDVCSDLDKSGKPLAREDRIRIPAKVSVITDPYTGDQYRHLVASSTLVLPVD